MKPVLYHNPRCSKSREALSLLQNKGVDFEIIEYLDTPFTAVTLQNLLIKLKLKPVDLLRKKEKIATELQLDVSNQDSIIKAMVQHPALVERPIFVNNDKAVVGRPPERVLEII